MEQFAPEELNKLVGWMRDVGATELVWGGVTLKLGPAPLRAVTEAPVSEGEALDDESAEERRTREVRLAWDHYWEVLTLSSGSPTPAFPGVENAEQFLGRLEQ